MNQTDLWQVVPRQAFTPHNCLMTSFMTTGDMTEQGRRLTGT